MGLQAQQRWARAGAVIAVITASAVASGQPAPPGGGASPKAAPAAASDPGVEELKRHFAAGRAAADAKNWPAAVDAFAKAYALKPLPQIAGNLGEAELRSGRFRDAAEHISKFLREDKGATAEDKKAGEDWLAEAKKKVVTLKIEVVDAGAEVLIDGKPMGVSPLPPEVYVEPGTHTVVARLGATSDEVTDTYQAGWARVMRLVPKEPAAAPGRIGSGAGTVGTGKVATAPTVPAQPGGTPLWLRPAVLIGSGAVAVVSLVIGIAGISGSAMKLGERDRVCVGATCLREGHPDFDDQQEEWEDIEAERVTLLNMAIPGLVIGGLAAAGTGIAYFVWKPPPSKSGTLHGVTVAPAGAGLSIKANW